MSITDLGEQAAVESETNNDSGSGLDNEYERFDLDGCAFGRQHPTTAVSGEAVALRRFYDENDQDRADVAVILDNPDIITGEPTLEGSVVVQSDEEGDQFKVVNTDDEQTNKLEGTGIDFAGNLFYGEIEDDFGSIERIALKRGGGAGRRITKTLEVDGATAAEAMVERDEDGQLTDMTLDDDGFPAHNGGYIEYDNEGDTLPRQSREPELRDDVAGQEVVIMIQRLENINPDYEGPSYWATVFANLPEDRQDEITEQYAEDSDKSPDDFVTELGDGSALSDASEDETSELDGTEFVKLAPTDEFEPTEANVSENGWIEFGGIDRSDTSEVLALNTQRLADGQGSVYIPEGQSPDDVVPDSVDNLELDPGEDDWDEESDATPAFGAGAQAEEVEA